MHLSTNTAEDWCGSDWPIIKAESSLAANPHAC